VVVLTNSSLLSCPAVRRPSGRRRRHPIARRGHRTLLPAINRPLPSIKVEDILTGLELFRRGFRQIWLEIMLVKGINDSPDNIKALKKAIARIRPDRIQ